MVTRSADCKALAPRVRRSASSLPHSLLPCLKKQRAALPRVMSSVRGLALELMSLEADGCDEEEEEEEEEEDESDPWVEGGETRIAEVELS